MPYTPPPEGTIPNVLSPPIHVHSFFAGLNTQRSLREFQFELASKPWPPKSQRFPLPSLQLKDRRRLPRMLAAAGTPRVPYHAGLVAIRLQVIRAVQVLLPPIHAHLARGRIELPKVMRIPSIPVASSPCPPKSPKLLLVSFQICFRP